MLAFYSSRSKHRNLTQAVPQSLSMEDPAVRGLGTPFERLEQIYASGKKTRHEPIMENGDVALELPDKTELRVSSVFFSSV